MIFKLFLGETWNFFFCASTGNILVLRLLYVQRAWWLRR